jgi:hypothetical protein
MITGAVVVTRAGVPDTGVATGADGEPIHPAMLIVLMRMMMKTTAHFPFIIPRQVSEVTTITLRRDARGFYPAVLSPPLKIAAPGLLLPRTC